MSAMKLSPQAVDREMRKLPAQAGAADFLRGYLNTELQLLGLSVPIQRARFKRGYPELESLTVEQRAEFWLKVWNETNLYESMSQAILFFESWSKERVRLGRKGRLKRDVVHSPLWPYLIKMIARVDNWAHSDGLSSLISAAVEEAPRERFPILARWNQDKRPWYRRQSIVSLHYYARQRGKPLPTSKTLPLIRRLIHDEHFYVQRGVGWALRESYNASPATTLKFLDRHIGELSAIAFSAATEKLTAEKKAALKKLRRERRRRKKPANIVREEFRLSTKGTEGSFVRLSARR